MPPLEPIGVYPCNPNLPLVVEARLGNGQLGTILLIKPAGQSTTGLLERQLGPGAALVDKVLDLRATAMQGNTLSPVAVLTVDVYQLLPGGSGNKIALRSFGDSKGFGENQLARLMVSVMIA